MRGSRDENIIDVMEILMACAQGAASATGKVFYRYVIF